MSSLSVYKQSKRLEESLLKQTEHLQIVSKILEKNNQVEFFKNASVIFEKLFQKYYRGGKKNDSYFKQRRWLFEILEKHYPGIITYSALINESLSLLSKYRNKIMHELESTDDTEELKEKLIINLQKLYQDMFELDRNIETYSSKEIENKFEVLLGEDKLLFFKHLEDIKSNIKEDGTKIDTYDMQLYTIILSLYSSLYGMMTGLTVREIETLETIYYEVKLDEPINHHFFNEIEVEIYSHNSQLFLKQKDNQRYQLKLTTTFYQKYWKNILDVFKKKRKVRLHQKDEAFTMEFLEDFIGMS